MLWGNIKSLAHNTLTKVFSYSVNRKVIEDLHEDPKLKEKCGVLAYFNKDSNTSFEHILASLGRLQHRGQHAAGFMAANEQGDIINHAKKGLISEVFQDSETKQKFEKQKIYLGHTLYTTSRTEGCSLHAQPILAGEPSKIALVHNGNLPDCSSLKNLLKTKYNLSDEALSEMNDSTLMATLISKIYNSNANKDLIFAVDQARKNFTGAYSIIVSDGKSIVSTRDNNGLRPLLVGFDQNRNPIAFASESAALKTLGINEYRDLQPGELFVIKNDGSFYSYAQTQEKTQNNIDAFEYIYFSRPDSKIEGKYVNKTRRNAGKLIGQRLKKELGNIDFVIPVPESGNAAASGLAEAIQKPINFGLIKNRHLRTFIENGKGLDEKFSICEDAIFGKKIVLVDDSIVRGNTTKKLIEKIREYKPAEIHLVIASPPVLYPDFYGIDTPMQDELIAAKKLKENPNLQAAVEAIKTELGIDSLNYLKIDELCKAIERDKDQLNLAAFNGDYPVNIGENSQGMHDFILKC
jgi:amidophosphoribosyltransferase